MIKYLTHHRFSLSILRRDNVKREPPPRKPQTVADIPCASATAIRRHRDSISTDARFSMDFDSRCVTSAACPRTTKYFGRRTSAMNENTSELDCVILLRAYRLPERRRHFVQVTQVGQLYSVFICSAAFHHLVIVSLFFLLRVAARSRTLSNSLFQWNVATCTCGAAPHARSRTQTLFPNFTFK